MANLTKIGIEVTEVFLTIFYAIFVLKYFGGKQVLCTVCSGTRQFLPVQDLQQQPNTFTIV